MKYLKLFEEMRNIEYREFPHDEHDLSPREKKILTDLVGVKYLNGFTIKTEDHYYYSYHDFYYNMFSDFIEFKDYVISCYHMDVNQPEEYLNILTTSKLDPSFDENRPIRWASLNGHIEIVKLLLNDKRVDPSEDENWSIRWAARRRHKEIVELLLNDSRVSSKLTEEGINHIYSRLKNKK